MESRIRADVVRSAVVLYFLCRTVNTIRFSSDQPRTSLMVACAAGHSLAIFSDQVFYHCSRCAHLIKTAEQVLPLWRMRKQTIKDKSYGVATNVSKEGNRQPCVQKINEMVLSLRFTEFLIPIAGHGQMRLEHGMDEPEDDSPLGD